MVFNAQFDGQQMLLAPEGVGMLAGLKAEVDSIQAELAGSDDRFWGETPSFYRPYRVESGILTIPIRGVLLHDFPYATSYATGYAYIEEAVLRGAGDPAVKTIILDINSPGGHVAGCHDSADLIFAARDDKPIIALVRDAAYSAAYWLASAATEIVATATAGVGSIGVITTHVDFSESLAKSGIKVTHIHAGAKKADGAGDAPLSSGAKSDIQARIDGLYDLFTATVARNRGIDVADVRVTEAGTFPAAKAIEMGLADRISNRADMMAALITTHATEETSMSEKDAATAAQEVAAAVATATADATAAALARVASILGSDAAKARPAAANAFALDADLAHLSADQVIAKLNKLPEEATSGAGFEALMNGTPNPEISQMSGSADSEPEDEMMAAILANFPK